MAEGNERPLGEGEQQPPEGPNANNQGQERPPIAGGQEPPRPPDGEGVEGARESRVTEHDREEFIQLEQKFRNVNQNNQQLTEGDPKKLTQDERTKLVSFLNAEVPLSEVQTILGKLNISQNEALKYSELSPIIIHLLRVEAREGRMPSQFLARKFEEARRKFDPRRIIKDYLTEDDQGNLIFTEDKKREFRKTVTEYYYYFFQDIDRNPSQLFDQIYSPFVQGSYTYGLQGLLTEIVNSEDAPTLLSPQTYKEFKDFMVSMNVYGNSLFNYGQLFHDLPIYAMDPTSHEKWTGFLSRLFPSETALFFDDPVLQIARSEVERFIRMRIALNGNKIPHDIFGGGYSEENVVYQFKDQEELRRIIKQRLEKLEEPYEEWEIDRAISYSRGIGLMNLRDIETMGTADSTGDFKGIPDLVAELFQRHKWKQGRGGFEITHIPELFTMDVTYNPERKSLIRRLVRKRRWVPEQIKNNAEQKLRELGPIIDRALLDRKGYYQELMNILNIGGLISRAAWRVEHLLPIIKERLSTSDINLDYDERNKWGRGEWSKFFDIATEELGAGSLWFYIDARVSAEMKRSLDEVLGYDIPDHEVREYALGEKAFEKVFEIKDEDGKTKKVNFYDFRQAKEWYIKGEVFNYLFRRSPGDFLLNLIQLVPELTDPTSDIWLEDQQIRDKYKDSPHKAKQALSIKRFVLEKWSDQEFEQLRWIKDWFSKLVSEYKGKEIEGYGKLDGKDKVLNYFFEQMGTALENIKKENEENRKENKEVRIDMKEKDIQDEKLRKLVFDGGIVTYISSLKEDFGDYNRTGDYGFFYKIGRAWSIKQGDINPNTTDLDYFLLYKDIAQAGESVIRRLHSDVDTWHQVVSQIANLDEILWRAGKSKNFDEIHKLHQGVHSLEGIIGSDGARRANYLLASLVTSYFWEHSAARISGGVLVNLPIKLFLGRKISLSKLHQGFIGTHAMDENEIRNYFRHLALGDNPILAEKGRNSYEQGQLAFDAKTDAFIVGNVLPSIISLVALYMFYKFIKDSLSEEFEVKKSR